MPGALLAAVLQRVQAEVGHVGRFGVAEDAEDAALVFEFVEHVSPGGLQPAATADVHATASRSIAESRPTRRVRRPPASRRPPRSPPTAMRSERPPVRPMIRAGTPARAACCTTSDTASGAAETTTREADSPNSAAARLTASAARHGDAIDRHVGADAVRVEAALRERHRQAAIGTVVRGSHETIARPVRRAAPAAPARRRDRAAGGMPRTTAVHELQILAASELAAALAKQHDDVAGGLKAARDDAIGMLEQADDADDGRRDRSRARRSRCTG